jgi:two-component system, OmpR family, response regulator VicR
MRKRILIVRSAERMGPVIEESLDSGTFEIKCQIGLSGLAASVLAHKPALALFEIPIWDDAIARSLSELMSVQGSRSVRKIVLVDRAEFDDAVKALDSGADDFLIKPISPREFLGRIGAVLRSHPGDWVEEIQTLGELSLYRGTMEVCAGSERKKLTPKEFEVLGYLMDNPGLVFSREKLLEIAWVPWEIEDRRVVDVYISRIRDKIEDDPSQPRRLLTRRGEGYFIVDPALSRR